MTLQSKYVLASCLAILIFAGCQQFNKVEFSQSAERDIPLCGPGNGFEAINFKLPGDFHIGRSKFNSDSRLLGSKPSGFPRVIANDNRIPAGNLKNDFLEINLEVVWADFRIETPDRPGLRVLAIAESGKSPSIPAPLIRVKTGTRIRATIQNTLTDSAITVFGFQKRPSTNRDSLIIGVGQSSTLEFDTGEPGTYFYWIRNGVTPQTRTFDDPEEEQLAGAFIIDPKEGSPPDRIFVMNVFSSMTDTTVNKTGFLEALTINGMSWPFTELQKPNVGDTLHWRIINASRRQHPMHLHGFYYDVISRGTLLTDNIYAAQNHRTVVTETMQGVTTMAMKWVASRPGKWLFHCHLSFHVSSEVRLPGASSKDPKEKEFHMAGLVLGIEVQPGASDLITRGNPHSLTIYANDYGDSSKNARGFSLSPKQNVDEVNQLPGPILILKQYQETNITVVNNMSIPTSIHWHGLELDSWADGVPGWSSSDGKTSPVLNPGEKFTYKLSLLRAGTFIYHSHFDDVHQLTSGLYGPMIVLAENDTFDPKTDHIYIKGWKTPNPTSFKDLDLNGINEQPEQNVVVGENHRIRVMNIAPAGIVFVRMLRGEDSFPLKFIAKDGADLPIHQQVKLNVSPRFGVGETADFMFEPNKPGTYTLHIASGLSRWEQTWTVASK